MLTGYAIFLASIVIYRVIFAIIYILSWKVTFCCAPRYKFISSDLEKISVDEKLRASSVHGLGHSNDDEAQTMGLLGKSEITNTTRIADVRIEETGIERPLRYDDPNDPDYDITGYQEADVEEAEDKIRTQFRKNKKKLNMNEIENMSGSVRVDQMNMSLLMQVASNPDEIF